MIDTDYLVIGAGIAGISCAARLAKQHRVIVIEAESQPGFHATGRSAAYFAPAYGNPVVREVTAASEAFFRNPPAGFTSAPLIRPRASAFIARADQRLAVDAMCAETPHLRQLDSATIRDRVPILNEQVVAAAWDDTGGDLDVDAILQGFLRLFRREGGELITGHRVRRLEFAGDRWVLDGQYRAPVVVNAAGAWADPVAACAGLDPLRLQPLRRTALLVDCSLDLAAWPLVIDVDEQFYFKPDASKLLISPADESPSAPCDAHPEELDVALAVDRVQQVADLPVRRIEHQWAGLRTFAPDRTFIAGFDPRCEGFFWLAGQGGYGVQTCPGLSAIAACLLDGDASPAIAALTARLADQLSPQRLLI